MKEWRQQFISGIPNITREHIMITTLKDTVATCLHKKHCFVILSSNSIQCYTTRSDSPSPTS